MESKGFLLGLKGLVGRIDDSGQMSVVSPSIQEFRWNSSGYAEAICGFQKSHTPPGIMCACGIYAASEPKIVLQGSYVLDPNSVVVLLAARGETEVWSGGWRAEAAQVVAVVSNWHKSAKVDPDKAEEFKMMVGRQEMTAMMAADYFEVDLVDLAVALEMIDLSWKSEGYVKGRDGWYVSTT